MAPQIPPDVSDFIKATAAAIVAGDPDARANFDAFFTAVARDHPDLPAAIDLQLDTKIRRAKVAAMLAAIPEFGRAYTVLP
jgi:uncharacterized protein with von Willebrand factor type A (vWA) domain